MEIVQKTYNRAEKVKEYYQVVASIYDGFFNHKIDKAERNIIYGYLKHFQKLRTLELGCGTGEYAQRIDPYDYMGIDISKEMINNAILKRDRLGISRCRFLNKNFLNIDMPKNRESYDFIVSTFNSIAYTDDPEEVVNEMNRYLRPGGRFFIMLPGTRFIGSERDLSSPLELMPYDQFIARKIFEANGRFKILRTWGLNIQGNKAAKILPPLLLRLYLMIESIIFRKSDKFNYIIVEGFKPLPPEEKENERKKTHNRMIDNTIKMAKVK